MRRGAAPDLAASSACPAAADLSRPDLSCAVGGVVTRPARRDDFQRVSRSPGEKRGSAGKSDGEVVRGGRRGDPVSGAARGGAPPAGRAAALGPQHPGCFCRRRAADPAVAEIRVFQLGAEPGG